MRQVISTLLIAVLAAAQSAQTAQELAKIRTSIEKIGTGGNVSVCLRDGKEFYGRVVRIDSNGFSVDEVDQKIEIPIRYDSVRKVREGYGSGHTITGRRIHPHIKLITTLAVVGGLLALVFIAVASDHS